MSDPERVRRGQRPADGTASGAKTWIAVLLGAFVILASHQLRQDSLFAALAVALRPLAWLIVALGLVFLAFRYLTRGRQAQDAATESDDPQPGMTRPSVLQALGIGRGDGMAEIEPRFVDTIAVHPEPAASDEDGGPPPRETLWSPRVLAQMDWRHFEALCRAFFTQAGFATSAQGHGLDGGVDIWVQSRHMPEPRIVRCRHWEGRPVGVKELREFLGVMSAQGLAHGTYVTSSTFSPDASEFAKANGIQMQDGAAMLRLISHRTPEQQQALLDVAYGEASSVKR